MSSTDENAPVSVSEAGPELGAKRISIVVTVYNESEAIPQFFSKLIPVIESVTSNYEIVCVNDGSSDDSLECLEAIRRDMDKLIVLNLSRNFGKEAALTAGLEYDTNPTVAGDFVTQEPDGRGVFRLRGSVKALEGQ